MAAPIACSLGSLLSIDEILECSRLLSGTAADTVWIPETWGMEAFSMLAAASARAQTQRIGSSIINIYSRSPAAIAMGAATVDTLSGGRLVLGLGASSRPIVEGFHGYRFRDHLQRMREYVRIIRLLLSGARADHDGEIFGLRGFALLIRPVRPSVPIYLAAVNPGMVDLAWEIGDGVIFYLRPMGEMGETIARMRSSAGRDISVACQLITAVDRDSGAARERAKRTVAFYVSVGGAYRRFLAENGFAGETAAILEGFRRSGLGSVHELVPDRMLDSLAIAGTPDECLAQLGRFRDTGMDLPIIQFNPVGDTLESFGLLRETFFPDRGR